MPLDCTNNNLSLEQIMASVITTDLNGNCAVRLIPILDGNAPWKDCTSKNQDVTQLIRRLVGVDIGGNLGIRVIEGTDSGNNCKDCTKKQIPLNELIVNHVIGLGIDGHPALRLATL